MCLIKDGSQYEGQWKEDMMHGRGTFDDKKNAKFVGEYHRGKFMRRLASLGKVGPDMASNDEKNSADKEAASIKIQNVARSKKAKKRVARRRREKKLQAELGTREFTSAETQAATRIQAGQRGKRARKGGKSYPRKANYLCGQMVLILQGDEDFVRGTFKFKVASKVKKGGTWEKQDSGDIALITPKQGTGIVVLSGDDAFAVSATNEAAWLVVTAET